MNISHNSAADTLKKSSFAAGALILLACLTFTFFNTYQVSFTSTGAHSLIGWFCVAITTACLALFMTKEKASWAVWLFFALFLLIVMRQGPKPIHSTALALIVLTMACVAHTAGLFARSMRWASALAAAIVLISTLNALVALYQYFGFSIQYPIPYIQIAPEGTAIGQVRQRNQMAILCALGLTTLAYFPFKFRWLAVARYGLGLCLIAAVAASASRIGAIAVLALSFTLVFTFRSLQESSKWLVGLAFPVLLVLAYLLPLPIEDRVGLLSRLTTDVFAVPCNSRILLWKNAFSLIWQAPLAGVGWGGLIAEYYVADLPNRGCEMIDHAHNVYLQIAVEAGLPAALTLVLVSAWFFIKHWSTVRVDGVYRWAYFSVGIIWLYSQTEFPLWQTGFLWFFAIFLGLSAVRHEGIAPVVAVNKWQRFLVAINPKLILLITFSAACISAMALFQFARVSSIETAKDWEALISKRGYSEVAKENWMFAPRLEFIVAQFQRPTSLNAEKINKFCKSVMTYSPDAPIIMCVIRSAYLMGDMKQVEFHKQRLLTIYGSQVDTYKKELENFK